jgi:hypothetical protein
MNTYEWIRDGMSRFAAGILIFLVAFGGEILSIHVRVTQQAKNVDNVLRNDKKGIRISFIPLTAVLLYDAMKGLPLWDFLTLTMWVVGMYVGVRWTEMRRKN